MTYSQTGHTEEEVYESLQKLAARVSRLETQLGLAPIEASLAPVEISHSINDVHSAAAVPAAEETAKYEGSGLELRIGEFGLAWIGSAVLFLGIVFLTAYTRAQGYSVFAGALGYAAALGLYALARVWRHSIPHLSQVMVMISLLLLYYTTMRLGFFSVEPLVGNTYVALLLLLIVVGVQFALAIRRHSQALAGIAVFLAVLSALLIDKTHVTLPLVAASCGVASYLAIRGDWRHVLIVTMFLVYPAHLLWLLSNPLMGHPMGAVSEHQYNLAYLFLYAAIFYLPGVLGPRRLHDDAHAIWAVLLNCLGFSFVAGLVVLTHFQKSYANVYISIAVFFLLLSVTQWLKTDRQYRPAIYACFGYLALSIAIYGYAKVPASFFWLSLQSLLVVSMALWFRSRTLVIMNSLIFVSILPVYVITSPSSDWVNFSFALMALASARVMNWQRERLTLRTDLLRNLYLAIAFVLIFYALYHAAPGEYVTLSWTATAVVYFLVSRLLHNVKYRLMAISAILVTVCYLFLVDLSHLAPLFRVAAFLFVGLMALVISLFYNRLRQLLGKTGDSSSEVTGR
jgi:hypothetical protein